MNKKINLKILLAEIRGKIREFYPYFIGFYILSLVVAYFSKTWSGFFYWPAFHGSVGFYTLLFVLTFEVNFRLNYNFQVVGLVKNSARQARDQFHSYYVFIYSKLAGLSLRTWLKILFIGLVLIFSLFKGIEVLDFLVLFYALISFLFILDSRVSAGLALVFLASCPLLLIFKQDVFAESAAVYAYYFLVITVLTQIREMKKAKGETCG